MSILGVGGLMEAIRALDRLPEATGCACQPQSAFLHSLGQKLTSPERPLLADSVEKVLFG
jgi:hypothetical protein